LRKKYTGYNRRDDFLVHVILAKKDNALSQQREGRYKTQLTKNIENMFPGRCIVIRLDAGLRQGVPDMAILFEGGFWVFLEAKTSATADRRPNQEYYIQKLDEMCAAAFIYPENEEAVLHAIQQEFEVRWATRLS
jgi:hypothetical protein